MSAKFLLRKQEFEVRHGISIGEALRELEISPESVLPTRKGELVDEDQILQEGDVIRLVRVIAGG